MLEIQKYLTLGGTPERLLSEYAIKHRRHAEFPNLVLFKYNQQTSPFREQIVRECRGIILDESNEWRVVARAFDKFFNYGEDLAAPIDWNTAVVEEKIDGSLCVMYFYGGTWHVATTGIPDAGGPVNDTDLSFRDLFWEAWASIPGNGEPNPEWCYMFELTSAHNRIVVQHASTSLTFLGARHVETGRESCSQMTMALLGRRPNRPMAYSLSSIDDMIATFYKLDPLKTEGYVVRDAAFNRIKVKHPGYVTLHHLGSSIFNGSKKRLIEVVLAGESNEVIAAFPEMSDRFCEVRKAIAKLTDKINSDYESIMAFTTQKDFAFAAKSTVLPDAMFKLRSGKVTRAAEYVRGMRPEQVEALL